jgi:hypothetical protein
MGFDSGRVPIVAHWMPPALYSAAAVLFLAAWWAQRLSLTLDAMAFGVTLGLGRAACYAIDDGRTFPIALHVAFALALFGDYRFMRTTTHR